MAVRRVAATNPDPEAMAEDGSFHRDLYDRLDAFSIPLPPLRERPGDIPHPVGHPAQRLARRMNECIESIPAETMAVLADCAWPGNVRELENLIERAVIASLGPLLEGPAGDLRAPSPPQPALGEGAPEDTGREGAGTGPAARERRVRVEALDPGEVDGFGKLMRGRQPCP